jgi:hypothetical protein
LAVSVVATDTSFDAGVTKSFMGEMRNAADSSSFAALALFVENFCFHGYISMDIIMFMRKNRKE